MLIEMAAAAKMSLNRGARITAASWGSMVRSGAAYLKATVVTLEDIKYRRDQ